MKNTKSMRIIVDLVLIILGIIFLVFGIKDAIKQRENSKTKDNVLFSTNYKNVSTDNVYKYINNIDDTDGLILICNPHDPYCYVLAPVLNDIAKENDIIINYYEKDTDIPLIKFRKDKKDIKDIKKEDIFDKNYNGILIEYFNYDKIDKLKSLLKEYINKIK